MQTIEDRIRRHFKATKRWAYREGWTAGQIFMFLARCWGRPIREIKSIVGYRAASNPIEEP